MDELIRVLGRLMKTERVLPQNIAVLAPEGATLDLVRTRLARKSPVSRAGERQPRSLTFDTVRRFKGLESQVVILLATRALLEHSEQIYVALTRARTYLVVIGPGAVLAELQSGVEQPR